MSRDLWREPKDFGGHDEEEREFFQIMYGADRLSDDWEEDGDDDFDDDEDEWDDDEDEWDDDEDEEDEDDDWVCAEIGTGPPVELPLIVYGSEAHRQLPLDEVIRRSLIADIGRPPEKRIPDRFDPLVLIGLAYYEFVERSGQERRQLLLEAGFDPDDYPSLLE